MSLTKNQIVSLEITGITAQGSGVGRVWDEEGSPGMTVFVPFTAMGDHIRCRILKVQKNHAYGRLEEVVSPSADRIRGEADCPAFGKCGGCAWRHISYEAECRYKRQQVADALQRIGGLGLEPEPLLAAPQSDRYRNKAQFPVAMGPYRPMAGFYAPRSHRLVEVKDCLLQPPVFAELVAAVLYWAKKAGVSLYDEELKAGLLRHIYIRQAEATGEIGVCLVCTSGKLPEPRLLVEQLRDRTPDLAGVTVNINRADTNVVLGETFFTLWGQEAVEDELCGLRFRLSPQSFYQVNRRQAERLYELAAEMAGLTGEQTLLDLYCGTGTIGLSMAARAGRVIGVETVPQAVEDARRNAERNGIANARFLCADAGEAAVRLAREGVRPDVVVLDPPRKGCAPAVIDTVAAMAPRRVVYVSCDPATLARDLKCFAERGYDTRRAVPVDLFPRTPHVECCALLTKREDAGNS